MPPEVLRAGMEVGKQDSWEMAAAEDGAKTGFTSLQMALACQSRVSVRSRNYWREAFISEKWSGGDVTKSMSNEHESCGIQEAEASSGKSNLWVN